MKSNLVDIACEVVQEREKAIAVADGTMEQFNGRERLRWTWLPRAAVEVNDDGTVTMPESLALEKGLI